MAIYKLDINDTAYEVDVDEETSILWVIREHVERPQCLVYAQ